MITITITENFEYDDPISLCNTLSELLEKYNDYEIKNCNVYNIHGTGKNNLDRKRWGAMVTLQRNEYAKKNN